MDATLTRSTNPPQLVLLNDQFEVNSGSFNPPLLHSGWLRVLASIVSRWLSEREYSLRRTDVDAEVPDQ